MRHLDVRHLWIQDYVRDGRVKLMKKPGPENRADVGTKNQEPKEKQPAKKEPSAPASKDEKAGAKDEKAGAGDCCWRSSVRAIRSASSKLCAVCDIARRRGGGWMDG